MSGKPNVVECTFVRSDVADTPYFSTPWRLGANGLEENLGLGALSDYEQSKMEEVNPIIYHYITTTMGYCSIFVCAHSMVLFRLRWYHIH